LTVLSVETFFANACVGSPEIVAVDGVGRDTRLLFHALIFVKSAGVALDAGLAHASVRSGEILASVGPSRDGVADAFGAWSVVATFYAFIDIRGAGSAFPAGFAGASDRTVGADATGLRTTSAGARLGALVAVGGCDVGSGGCRLRSGRSHTHFVLAFQSVETDSALAPDSMSSNDNTALSASRGAVSAVLCLSRCCCRFHSRAHDVAYRSRVTLLAGAGELVVIEGAVGSASCETICALGDSCRSRGHRC